MTYLLTILALMSIFTILALSLNIVVGYSGLLTLAHAAYFAVGGYCLALCTQVLGFGFPLAVALAVTVCAFLSLPLSLAAWRFRGDTFVLTSLAIQFLLSSLLTNWYDVDSPLGTLRNMTNGPMGIAGISRPVVLGMRFDTLGSMAALAAVCALVATVLSQALTKSPWGRLMVATRDDELASRNLGKNVGRAKTEALMISCSLAGVAGALYASYLGYLDPSLGSLDQSMLLLCMVMVGGVGNLRGPIVGAIVLTLLPEILRLGRVSGANVGHVQLLAYGIVLVLMMHSRPQGIAGTYRIE